MSFASSVLSIEQVTFEADDQRCQKQFIKSFDSLVNFDSEFPEKESFSFLKNNSSSSDLVPDIIKS